jgi:thioesterase domain-containing protein
LIIYADADEVDAVLYDDKSGRGSAQSKLAKIHQYLVRYGPLHDWEMRMDNGWMRYWFNVNARVSMVYGIHKDVIRFNRYEGE